MQQHDPNWLRDDGVHLARSENVLLNLGILHHTLHQPDLVLEVRVCFASVGLLDHLLVSSSTDSKLSSAHDVKLISHR